MRRPALAAVVAAAVALPASAAAAGMDHSGHGAAPAQPGSGPHVSMLAADFAPAHVDVLAGDTVTWSNDSVRSHSVTAADGTWDSGSVAMGGAFARAFERAGAEEYYCRLHPFMRGDVAVHELLLTAPKEASAPGRPFTLAGRAALPADTAVTIEGDDGSGFRTAASAKVGADGGFRAAVTPATSTTYRAVAGSATSPAVRLLLLDRRVAATARRHGGRTTLRVRITPASPRATVVLQLHLRERFGWWPVRVARLDRDSRAVFRLRLHQRVRARVVLTLADGATVLARSPQLRVGVRGRRSGSRRRGF
jgi:plastocyanin